jgi:hypothetical protein
MRKVVDITGIKYNTLYARLIIQGWTADEAFTKPVERVA